MSISQSALHLFISRGVSNSIVAVCMSLYSTCVPSYTYAKYRAFPVVRKRTVFIRHVPHARLDGGYALASFIAFNYLHTSFPPQVMPGYAVGKLQG